MPPTPLEPGDPARLGRFGLVARLGEGGQGVVYLGRGTGPGEERVAVKVLRSSADATVLQRLARELDAVHQVQPFLTARVIEASVEGDRRFIVSEFIDGPSLQERVRARGPLPEGDLLRLAVGTATALTAIHGAGVVHRDFKPANVLLGPDGPRVLDFGIARLIDATAITTGTVGTPAFMAPEQFANENVTGAVDIWAWAVTMIFAATGRLAFDADTVPALWHRVAYEQPDVSGVPPSLLPVVIQCLDKNPLRRPSARDLLLRLVDPSAQRPPATRVEPASHSGPVPTSGPVPIADAALPADHVLRTGSAPGTTGPTISRGATRLSGTGTRSGRPRRGPILAVGGAAAAVAVIVVLLLTWGSPASHTVNSGSTSAVGRASSTATVTAPATTATAQVAGATIPSAFAGTWTGTATMSAIGVPGFGLQNSITFVLAAGGKTAHENNQSCVNTLTLSQATATVLTFSEPATPECVAGTVTFTMRGADLAYRWTNNVEQNTAVLHKS